MAPVSRLSPWSRDECTTHIEVAIWSAQLGHECRDGFAAALADDISDEEDLHACTMSASGFRD